MNSSVEIEIEDLEACTREGSRPKCDHHYRIRIDKEQHVVPVSHMTGRQILEVAGKCEPERWSLRQKLAGGKLEKIGLDRKVDFPLRALKNS
jgi:hypothetical protein